jgi:hypothetical protein
LMSFTPMLISVSLWNWFNFLCGRTLMRFVDNGREGKAQQIPGEKASPLPPFL